LVNGNNITIKNARINGFKVGIMARGCKNLKIINSDLSYNYRQHLHSNWLNEDISDWMSFHHNENDEWLRYGAGIYMKNCSKFKITSNIITNGQCGLMLVGCNDGEVSDNNFSFNSAIGVGMYRSSHNNVLHNKLDFNVRGYSDGFYNRGQDSGGLLVFEQCNSNVFAYNSTTHCGDGFFLWAGQTTMDNGTGGCNDNYIFKNDFSYAPTNGVEVTFSKNIIRDNIIKGCDHGIWGGYSWETSIIGNNISQNRIGIAIEQGQNNNISLNNFENNKQAGIKLWARKTQPADWRYAQKKDTRSRNYNLWENRFKNEFIAIDLALTENLTLYKNEYLNTKTRIRKDSSVGNLVQNPEFVTDSAAVSIPVPEKWKTIGIPASTNPVGRNQIRITEWGPYNFNYPILFLKKIDSNNYYYFDVLGPKGKWRLKNAKCLKDISINSGGFPAELIAQKNGDDVALELEYYGPPFTNQFGKKQPAGSPYIFSFRDYQPAINWKVSWFKWDAAHDPNKDYDLFKTVLQGDPVKKENSKNLNFTWWGAIGTALPADSFATVATSIINVKKGIYNVGVTADDLVKVYLDGKLLIDYWDAKKYVYDEDAHHDAEVELDGRHEIRIEHVENAGFATLLFTLKPL
jgi:parallel beta-helix repeat protein